MGALESKGVGGLLDGGDRMCGQCNDDGSSGHLNQSFCVKRGHPAPRRFENLNTYSANNVSVNGPPSAINGSAHSHRSPVPEDPPMNPNVNAVLKESLPNAEVAEEVAAVYNAQQEPPDTWRYQGNDEGVGVGAYFGRLEGQKDSVARVKRLVSGGPAEQTGMIEVNTLVAFSIRGDVGQLR